jgi:hypothetical protein
MQLGAQRQLVERAVEIRIGAPIGLAFDDHSRGRFAAELHGIGGAQHADRAALQYPVDEIALENPDGPGADDAGAGDIRELGAFTARRDDHQACGRRGFGADAEQARQESRLSIRGRAQARPDFDEHRVGACLAHRDAAHEQRPDVDARHAIVDAHVAALVVDVGHLGAETSGDRAVYVFNPERHLAHALGQARHREAQSGFGVDHPGEEAQEYDN